MRHTQKDAVNGGDHCGPTGAANPMFCVVQLACAAASVPCIKRIVSFGKHSKAIRGQSK